MNKVAHIMVDTPELGAAPSKRTFWVRLGTPPVRPSMYTPSLQSYMYTVQHAPQRYVEVTCRFPAQTRRRHAIQENIPRKKNDEVDLQLCAQQNIPQ